MSASFTPGPWQSKHDYTVEGATTIIANVDGESFSDGTTSHTYDFIATCEDEYGERLPNAQANARLIRAAPELYREAAFLCERLRDFSHEVDASDTEDTYRQFHGHVEPSLTRLEILLARAGDAQ